MVKVKCCRSPSGDKQRAVGPGSSQSQAGMAQFPRVAAMGHESQAGFWGLNLDPLEEQSVLLTRVIFPVLTVIVLKLFLRLEK